MKLRAFNSALCLITASFLLVSCSNGSSGNSGGGASNNSQLSQYVASLQYYPNKTDALAANKNQLLIPISSPIDLQDIQVNFYGDKNCSNGLSTVKMTGNASLKQGYYLTTDKANFMVVSQFDGGLERGLATKSINVSYQFKNGNSTISRCFNHGNVGEKLADWGHNANEDAKLQATATNPIACSASSCQFAEPYVESLSVLSYQISYPNTPPTGIGSSYSLVVTNNSAAAISLTGLQFTLRADAAMQDAPAISTSSIWGVSLSNVSQSVGQCYGVNNGVCNVMYDLTLSSSQTLAANGGSITVEGMPNGNSQTAGGSTSGGLPLYNDVAHNVYGYNATTGNVYTSSASSIYNNLQNPNPNKLLGAYFADWTNYSTPSGRMFPAESAGLNSFPVPYINSLTYDVGYLNGSTGSIGLADNWADPTYLQQFSYLRAAHPWLNMAISFGGWGSGSGTAGYPSQDLQQIFEANSPSLIQQTAANMINTAILYGFNGVDIDFEQGVCNISASWCVNGTLVLDATSVANYQALLSALSTYAKQVTTESSGSPLYGTVFNISAALPVGINALQSYINLGGNYQTVLESVTYGNLMAYDYHGQFDAGAANGGVSDALAGLYRSQYSYGSSNYEQYYDINDTLTCGTTANQCGGYLGYFALAPNMSAKLNLGIPTYTRVENLASAATSNDTAIYQTLASSQTWTAQGGGVVSYRCVYNSNYCAQAKGDYLPQDLTSSNLVAWNYSSAAMMPWFYYVVSGTPYFGTFDNGQSAANKVSYANTQGLNGYFTWEIDEDVPMQDASYAQYGITNNICSASGSCLNQ